jgi:hypothetical protein
MTKYFIAYHFEAKRAAGFALLHDDFHWAICDSLEEAEKKLKALEEYKEHPMKGKIFEYVIE